MCTKCEVVKYPKHTFTPYRMAYYMAATSSRLNISIVFYHDLDQSYYVFMLAGIHIMPIQNVQRTLGYLKQYHNK